MRFLQGFLGLIAILLGMAGVVLSVAAIGGAWWYNTPLTDTVMGYFPQYREVVVTVDATLAQVERVEDDVIAVAEASSVALPLAEAAVGEEAVAAALEAAAELLGGLLGGETAAESAEGATAAPTIDPAASAEALAALIAQLERLQQALDTFNTLVDEAVGGLDVAETSLPRWIDYGSLAISALALWFGIAQAALVGAGWRWLRG